MSIFDIIIYFFASALSSMGLGGGSVLVLYQTIVKQEQQKVAQGLNLLSFLPSAIIAIYMYWKQKIIIFADIAYYIIGGIMGSIIGGIIFQRIGNDFLTKIFAIFLLYSGVTGIVSLLKKNK